jgi:hypothetical protein
MISQVCALQKQYGKTQAELETLVEGFSWALAEYNIADITKAMAQYIKTANDIPAPFDIIKIIEENKKWENFQAPSVETLLRYRAKGIPLSETQKQVLMDAGL